MRILGIDPGTGRTGWGIIEIEEIGNEEGKYSLVQYGCFTTPKEAQMGERLVLLQDLLMEVITQYHPQCMAVEQLFFGINSRTAMTVGQARGVVILTSARCNVSLFEYQGLSVKRELTGSGKADKRCMQETVKSLLSLKEIPRPDDAADALGVAICHAVKTGMIHSLIQETKS